MDRNRETANKQRQTDSPPSFCCDSLQYAVEKLGYIQYEAFAKEYTFANFEGFGVIILNYCPYCGRSIPSLGPLINDTHFDYVMDQELLTDEEFDRYWPIISQQRSIEETMALIAEQKTKEAVTEEGERKLSKKKREEA